MKFWRVEFLDKGRNGSRIGTITVQAGNERGAMFEAAKLLGKDIEIIRCTKL